MKRLFPAALFAALATAATPFAAGAAPSETDYASFNQAFAAGHAIPGYTAFAKAAAAFRTTSETYCGGTGGAAPDDLRGAFIDVLGAWMAVEHIRFGPVEEQARYFRIHFWPDRGGRVRKHIRVLLAAGDPDAFTPRKFATASVAVQGLTAAERLLFGAAPQRITNETDGGQACRFVVAVATNLAAIGAAVAEEWRVFKAQIATAGRPGSPYPNHRDISAEFLKGAYTSLQVIVDQKLARPLDKDLKAARPKRAESWRSQRSLANIVDSLTGIRALYEGGGGFAGLRALVPAADAAAAKGFSSGLEQTLATAKGIGMPLAEAVTDPAARPKVERLALEARALKDLVTKSLAPAVGLPLGFNALDGD